MSAFPRPALLLATCMVALGPGCSAVTPRQGDAALVRSLVPADAVALEMLTLRVPADAAALDESLWIGIDELQFPTELRRRLAANGIRAGVIGARLPASLEQLLKSDGPSGASTDANPAIQVSDFENEPRVRRRIIETRSGRKMKFVCIGEKERVGELSLLLRCDDGAVNGRTYRKVMGLLLARAFPEGDGRVRLEVLPEIEHGDPQRRFEPGDGMMRVEFGPARERFDTLRLEAVLSPGQTLLLTCVADRPGTLGHHFFTENASDRVVQKLVLVRLAAANYDDLFSPDTPAAEID